ncbi:MAG: CAP domain-containing protein [Flavobacterium sp.]|nr:CAP domain-containing protein [Flavobacterium sp.]
MRNTITILILFFNSFVTSAQELKLNYDALENTVLELMNQHRKSLNINALEKDIVLQKSAQDQSNYMLKIKKLAHEQNTVAKKYPKNRIKFHGGNDFNAYGENVLYLTVEPKTYAKNDIEALAKRIYEDWKNSPPHYKNIISKEFAYASLAFSYDIKSKRLYATTVFGNKKAN